METGFYPFADTINGPNLLQGFIPDGGPGPWAIAAHGGDLFIGLGFGWEKGFISEVLVAGPNFVPGEFPVIQSNPNNYAPIALTTDSAGGLYVAIGIPKGLGVQTFGEVDFFGPKGKVLFLQNLSFPPAGIAVDSAHERVYLPNQQGNQVLVHSTNGALLHTIH